MLTSAALQIILFGPMTLGRYFVGYIGMGSKRCLNYFKPGRNYFKTGRKIKSDFQIWYCWKKVFLLYKHCKWFDSQDKC